MTTYPSPMKDRLTTTTEGMMLWNQERSILDITELICEVMQKVNVTRTELAKRLGKTKGYVTQLLDGTTNMTVRTISDVFSVLGYEFRPYCTPMNGTDGSTYIFHIEHIEPECADEASGWPNEFVVNAVQE